MEKVVKVPTVFDSTAQQVGEVYARALLGVGKALGRADQLVAELAAFDDALQNIPRLAQTLQTPRVPLADKVRLIERSLAGRASREFIHFVQVLTRKGRFNCLTAVRQAATKLLDEVTGQVRATVTTASPLEDSARSRLADRLGNLLGKKVLVDTRLDESVIGGVVVRVGDTVYDASVANQLNQLRSKTAKRIADSIRGSLDRFASEI